MRVSTRIEGFTIRHAEEKDVPLIAWFIRELADYEKLSNEVSVTEDMLRKHLFGGKAVAEVVIGENNDKPVGFAVFFHNFSTFVGKPGLYLEDLYIIPGERRKGYGKTLLSYMAKLASERNCGRLEWAVLDWNETSIRFYESLGARLMKEWIINRVDGQALRNLAAEFWGHPF